MGLTDGEYVSQRGVPHTGASLEGGVGCDTPLIIYVRKLTTSSTKIKNGGKGKEKRKKMGKRQKRKGKRKRERPGGFEEGLQMFMSL